MMLSLETAISKFPDSRTGENSRYSTTDAGMGVFSVFYTQYPSFLSHQKMMEKRMGISNARTLFRVKNIPTANHIRTLLDKVSSEYLHPVFRDCFQAVKGNGYLDGFRQETGGSNSQLLIAMDGTQYFSSSKIQCKNCSTKTKNNRKNYSHQMINPAVVSPGNNKVICLEPEFIKPQDGDKKQDCESKAGKRWLDKHGREYADLNTTILADDLYSRQPMCEEILDKGLNFILVCKPDSHKTLYEYLDVYGKSDSICKTRETNKTRKTNKTGETKLIHKLKQTKWNGKYWEVWKYKYAFDLPLKDGKDALEVNWCELTITNKDTGKKTYQNSFVTNHVITKQNVESIVESGRARWKTENENINTLKTKGYNLNHNYGHGQKHLSSLLATMNVLAYLMHTMQDMMSKSYKKLREQIPTRKMFFDHIKTILEYLIFTEWEVLMQWMLKGLETGWPAEKYQPGTVIKKS